MGKARLQPRNVKKFAHHFESSCEVANLDLVGRGHRRYFLSANTLEGFKRIRLVDILGVVRPAEKANPVNPAQRRRWDGVKLLLVNKVKPR